MFRLYEFCRKHSLALTVAVIIFFTALAILYVPPAYAISQPVEIDAFKLSDTYYILIKNPEGQNITIQILDQNYNPVATYSSTATTIQYTFNQTGSWIANITADGTVIDTLYFGLGSIVDTGFKSMLVQAFKGDLFYPALFAMLGITIFAISMGRYAGMPIFLTGLGFFAYHNYLPSWLTYLVLLASAILFAIAIYRLTGGEVR